MPYRADRQAGYREMRRPAPARPAPADGPSGRVAFVVALFCAIAAVFLLRLLYLQVVVADEYSGQAQEARLVSVPLSPKRGTIYDRNGKVLATSIEATTVYCNPHEVEDADVAAAAVAAALGGAPADYRDALSLEESSFAYVKRKADVEAADKLREADLPGVYFLEDTKRVYPNGSIGGQVIGLVNIDGEGITGLELYYDDILAGTPGELDMEIGATGIVINGTEERTNPVDGQDITISLDVDLQQKVEQSVSAMAKDLKGKSGEGLVVDGGTGEILAAATTPLLNPANMEDIPERSEEVQCITRAFEPGSIFKTVTMLAALEEGRVRPTDAFYCPTELPADEYVVTDAHYRLAETMTATDILVRSSNVGMSLIAQRLGFDRLNAKLEAYGLNMRPTGVDYPGEAGGYLADFSLWSRIQGYNISFGQGVSVTPLQMARFYGALVNGGTACTPHFLIEKPQTGERPQWESEQIVQNTEAIAPLKAMLTAVVEEGTGTGAQIAGYSVAGKTGTAEYVDEEHEERGYLTDHYNVSFIGFLPDSDSKLVCFVGATEVPGEPATTEVFQDIMSYAIERYNVNSTQG